MAIPTTRAELNEAIEQESERLHAELRAFDADAPGPACSEDWTVAQLLAVRTWWSHAVCDWIEAGRRDEVPAPPTPGYGWKETPRLNRSTADAAGGLSIAEAASALRRSTARVLQLIGELEDDELLEPGAFEWCGKWPVRRWISVNTATQYASARKLVRRVRPTS